MIVERWTAFAEASPCALSDARKFLEAKPSLRAEAALRRAKVEPERIELYM
jgi:hypothetical protein